MKKMNDFILPKVPVAGNISVQDCLHALNRSQRSAVLATASDNRPYTSLVGFALTSDLTGVLFLTPMNTVKYRNLIASPHAALLIDNRMNTPDDLLGAEAVTLIGTAKPLRKGKKRDEMMKVFLEKHPELKAFAAAKTTALVFIKAERYIHVSQFQTVTVWDLRKG